MASQMNHASTAKSNSVHGHGHPSISPIPNSSATPCGTVDLQNRSKFQCISAHAGAIAISPTDTLQATGRFDLAPAWRERERESTSLTEEGSSNKPTLRALRLSLF